MPFGGFSRGALYTPVPNQFFGPLLEQINDLAELKVTLRGLWLWHRKRGWPQSLTTDEFLYDQVLLSGLTVGGKQPQQEIRRGLQLAVARGTFLLHRLDQPGAPEQVFFLNTESGRRALAQIRQGVGLPATGTEPLTEELTEQPTRDKPNIFSLYENNVGTLSPLLADQLKEAEEVYPWSWIKEAFEIAVTENKRSWRYITGILRRWAAEGKGDGKPGGYSQTDNRQRYLEEYQRRRGHLPWERRERGERAGR